MSVRDGNSAAREAGGRPASSPRAGIADIFLARLRDLEGRVEKELGRPASASGPVAGFALDVARESWGLASSLLESASSVSGRREFLAWAFAASPVDDLGFDAGLAETVRELVRPLARRWLGVQEKRGVALPDRGGVLVLLNRSAWPLPVEALVLWAFLCDGRLASRPSAVLWDGDLPELPFFSDALRRIGVLEASEDNARALLERGGVVLAFPEGAAARTRTYDRRYRLARFEGRSLLTAAMEAGARIVPGAVVGVEESFPLLGSVGGLPLTLQFPLLGPLGLLPLPVAWSLRLGAAVEYSVGDDGETPAVDGIADAVRARMQAMVGELLGERRSIVRG